MDSTTPGQTFSPELFAEALRTMRMDIRSSMDAYEFGVVGVNNRGHIGFANAFIAKTVGKFTWDLIGQPINKWVSVPIQDAKGNWPLDCFRENNKIAFTAGQFEHQGRQNADAFMVSSPMLDAGGQLAGAAILVWFLPPGNNSKTISHQLILLKSEIHRLQRERQRLLSMSAYPIDPSSKKLIATISEGISEIELNALALLRMVLPQSTLNMHD